MASYLIELMPANFNTAPAATYDAVNKKLVSTDSRIVIEKNISDWAIKINTDYSMVFDSDGLLVGDFEEDPQEFQKLVFSILKCGGIKQKIASLSQTGRLWTPAVHEVDVLPSEGMNLYDNVVISTAGLYTTKINEIWFLTDAGNYIVSDGQLIQINP